MSFFYLVEDFLLEKEVNNSSKSTIKFYQKTLKRFGEFIAERDINQKEVDKYKKELMDNLKPQSVNTYLRGLRTFINFYNYPIKVKLVREGETAKEVYNEAELRLLLKKPSTRNFHAYRTWVCINIFLSTGMRLGSLVEIKIEDVDLESGILKIYNTKNRKYQSLPISKQLERVLVEYMRRRGGSPQDYLICSSLGTKADKRTIQQQIKRYNLSRGVNKTSIHLFRHTFATMYLKNGGDLYRLQKLLGHSSIKVTEIYLHYNTNDLTKDFNQLNPLDKLAFKIK